jgi:hypothetical protein
MILFRRFIHTFLGAMISKTFPDSGVAGAMRYNPELSLENVFDVDVPVGIGPVILTRTLLPSAKLTMSPVPIENGALSPKQIMREIELGSKVIGGKVYLLSVFVERNNVYPEINSD